MQNENNNLHNIVFFKISVVFFLYIKKNSSLHSSQSGRHFRELWLTLQSVAILLAPQLSWCIHAVNRPKRFFAAVFIIPCRERSAPWSCASTLNHKVFNENLCAS